MDLYDPTSPEIMADPFPAFRRLREEAPVWWCPALKGWVVTRYEDVRAGLRDPRLSAERVQAFIRQLPAAARGEIPDLARNLSLWMVFLDPPDHTRMRRLMGPWFSASVFELWRPRIRQIVAELIDGFVERGECDLVADFAYPLPVRVIGDVLGVPRADQEPFKRWSDDLAIFVGRASATPGKLERAQAAARDMDRCFRDLVRARGKRPGEDLISRLVGAQEGAARLTEDEVVATCVLLFFAGHETTTALIANGMNAFLRHPEQAERLRSDPELAAPAVEEVLRYDGPSGAGARVVKESHEIGGVTVREGERVFLMVNAANRDPRRFEDPERLDIGRDPNPHLSFGLGVHFCIGAPLARIEGQEALPALLQRLGRPRLATDRPCWSDGVIIRALRALPITFEPSPKSGAA